MKHDWILIWMVATAHRIAFCLRFSDVRAASLGEKLLCEGGERNVYALRYHATSHSTELSTTAESLRRWRIHAVHGASHRSTIVC